MRKNTLFHHKKYPKNTLNGSINQSEPKDFFLQNPESSAKFCLLQISQESPKTANRTSNYLQTQHSRSYSTEFFNHKRMSNQNRLQSPEKENSQKRNEFIKAEIQQSVAMKSTFSNQMRKTHHPSSSHSFNDLLIAQKNGQNKTIKSGNDSMKKLRKINYLPFTVEVQREIENIDKIFRTAPSKQILAILNKTKLSREIKQNSKNFRQRAQEPMTARKKSIFNIRNLMLKQRSEDDLKAKRNQSSSKRVQSPNSFQPKQLHSTNRNVIKMRLKNRYNKSSNSRR